MVQKIHLSNLRWVKLVAFLNFIPKSIGKYLEAEESLSVLKLLRLNHEAADTLWQ